MKIYLAGPLFSLAEKMFNVEFAALLEKNIEGAKVILPQIKAEELLGDSDFENKVYRYCCEMAETCDVTVAMLEGSDADSGTCVEIALAKKSGRRVVGVRTDFRSLEDNGLNIMVSKTCDRVIWKPPLNIAQLAEITSETVKEILNNKETKNEG